MVELKIYETIINFLKRNEPTKIRIKNPQKYLSERMINLMGTEYNVVGKTDCDYEISTFAGHTIYINKKDCQIIK